MNTRRNVLVAILLGAGVGFAYHALAPTPKVAAAAQLGAIPGRNLEPPWWLSIKSPEANTYVVPSDVLFASASAFVGSRGEQVLRSLIPDLRGASSILVIGCTDSVGGADSRYNIALGLNRARASVGVLERDGLRASLFRIASWADTRPVTTVADLDTATVNALDRRIVVIVTK